MPNETLNSEGLPKIGKIFDHWTFEEHPRYQHGRAWYWTFAIIASSFLIGSLWTANFLLAVIVIMFMIIIFFREIREPEKVDFYLGENGMIIGYRVIDYKDLQGFWIFYEPPVKNLYFSTKKAIHHRISIPLLDHDPLAIRNFLLNKLPEDLEQEGEPLSEQLSRVLKI